MYSESERNLSFSTYSTASRRGAGRGGGNNPTWKHGHKRFKQGQHVKFQAEIMILKSKETKFSLCQRFQVTIKSLGIRKTT